MRIPVRFLPALFALVLLAFPATAQTQLYQPHEFFWTACQMGMTQACPILITDALGGNPEAQFRLGVLLSLQAGTDQDRKDGAVLILAAAKQGHAGALNALKLRAPAVRPAPAPRQTPERKDSTPLVQSPKYQVARAW
jgi:hypothetical protein